MALKIIDKKIVGEIYFLEEKLEGKIPIDRLELLYLINSWGRTESFYTFDINQDIYIKAYESKECYDLSKLDVSQIINMSDVFIFSKFNGDISSWNMSSVTDMSYMFYNAEAFQNKYNYGKPPLPDETNDIKEWFNNNREKMKEIDIKYIKNIHGKEIDDFFSNITDIYSTNRIGLHENLLTECNKLCL